MSLPASLYGLSQGSLNLVTTCPIPKQKETVTWVVAQLEHSWDSYPVQKHVISFKLFTSNALQQDYDFRIPKHGSWIKRSQSQWNPRPTANDQCIPRVSNSVGPAALLNEICFDILEYSHICMQYRFLWIPNKAGLIMTDISRYRRFRRPVDLWGIFSCHISGNALNFTVG